MTAARPLGHHAARGPSRHRGEAGTGLIGSLAGVFAFLVFLLFAVQLTANLYATSTVTAAGYDAARTVAARAVDHDDPASVAAAQRRAEDRFHQLLGEAGRDATISWGLDPEVVRLRVVVDSPTILPASLVGGIGMARIERTFVVRREALR